MQIISLTDFLLFPLYFFLFYFIIKLRSKKYAGTSLKKYFITAFFLHMGGCLLYALVVQYYYGYGDSFGYYYGSNFIRDAINAGVSPFKLLFASGEDIIKPFSIVDGLGLDIPTGIGVDSNFTVMKISAVLSYLSFNSYLVITLFFGLFSFSGLWRLYSTFKKISSKKSEKLLAYTVLYTPSICFWGSGLMKDTLCLGLVGFIIHLLYKLLILKKYKLEDILFFIILLYLLFVIKGYIASIMVVSLLLSYALYTILKSKKNIIRFYTVSFILVIIFVYLAVTLSSNITSIVEESKSQIEIFKGVYANADREDERSLASFTGADFDITLPALILRSPIAIVTTLFRPFLWETRKPIMLLSAIESFLMLLATLYVIRKCRLYKFFYYIFSDPYIFYAYIFVMILAAIIGFTTFNFGTMVRYRLPILPFYFFMLLSIYSKIPSKAIVSSTSNS